MSVAITQINTSSDTFQSWVDKTNSVIGAMGANVITSAATTDGGVTTGNAYANGVFAANVVAAVTTLRGGSVSTAANLNVTSNLHITGANLSANGTSLNFTFGSYANVITDTIAFNSNNFSVTGNTNLRANTLSVNVNGRVGVNTGAAAAALDVVGTVNFGSGAVTINSNTTVAANTLITANTIVRNGSTANGFLFFGDQSGGARGLTYNGTVYSFITANVNVTGTVLCPSIVKSGSANVTVDGVDVAAFKSTYDTRPILKVYDVANTQLFSM